MQPNFSEIRTWNRFEDLVAAYLRKLKEDKTRTNDIIEIDVKPPSIGVDGGRDILVTFRLDDGLCKFQRKWIIQCKFYKTNVSARELRKVNIPSLIHSYDASGYLLICRKGVTSTTTRMFEDLARECRFKYHYTIWTGNEFLERLLNIPSIYQLYFPKYWKRLEKIKKGKK